MDLNQIPRLNLTFLPTPVTELKRLSKALNGPRIFIKRDDLTGLGLGGNKTRKLEFLLADALAQKCNTVVTGGAAQSNHCRQTAAAAASVGLECHLALGGEKPSAPNGNLLLDYLFGAQIHWCGEQRKGEQLVAIAEDLGKQGRNPYLIPYGGSNEVGAMGYVAAMQELKVQLPLLDARIDHLILPSSSGGTHAGITVGADLFEIPVRILGIEIDKRKLHEVPYPVELASLANLLSIKLGREPDYNPDRFMLKENYTGGGYGVVGDLEREAIRLTARYEGILLDPVYTGRAMGALIDMIWKKEFTSTDTVLFWHTGGAPALFEYAWELL